MSPMLTRLLVLVAMLQSFAGLVFAQGQVRSETADNRVVFYDQELPPFWFFRDGRRQGISIDIMREVERMAQIQVDFEDVPLARADEIVKVNKGACRPHYSATSDRIDKFVWVRPVLYTEWQFFALQDSQISIKDFEEARKYRIGVRRGNSQYRFLMDRGPIQLDIANTEVQNIRKLQEHRIDLWAASSYVPGNIALSERISLRSVFTFYRSEVGVACNLETNPVLMEKMRVAIAAMRASGAIDAIVDRFVTRVSASAPGPMPGAVAE